MYGGPDMYDVARHITRDRLSRAEQTRNAAHIERQSRDRSERSAIERETAGSWSLEWTTNGLAGGRVTVRNAVTGETRTGRHPFDWDSALGSALRSSS